ncbi:hypothetical protein CEXT_272461 [Caerostris extrusa]|uniref:Uncharacterized protein n=1 Tax=Caerostris extrusa TaxID=172846 RepID=A0AAV4SUB8_CAEEX|nr:hypothetical protein CEXT_272461 [Caerostris extrusa]
MGCFLVFFLEAHRLSGNLQINAASQTLLQLSLRNCSIITAATETLGINALSRLKYFPRMQWFAEGSANIFDENQCTSYLTFLQMMRVSAAASNHPTSVSVNSRFLRLTFSLAKKRKGKRKKKRSKI